MTTGAPTSPYPARPRRSRLRTFLAPAVAAWLVLEIWLLTVVAGAAGGVTVFLLLVAGFVLGSVVVGRAGRRAFRSLGETLQARQPQAAPSGGNGSGNGPMMLGGLLLMLPGLISDAAGLLLLLPPVQKTVRGYAERTIDRRLGSAPFGSFASAFQQARMHRPDGKVVQGEVIRDDAPGTDGTGQGPLPPLMR
ncbi:FxsA family membrane protein [Streptomyces sp. NPDC007264]|uniref:FxsA family membrane protein n=1 Tax=Streptomyces sp. NPDC007264 TaxID=3364777 RepID=UPI0036D98828